MITQELLFVYSELVILLGLAFPKILWEEISANLHFCEDKNVNILPILVKSKCFTNKNTTFERFQNFYPTGYAYHTTQLLYRLLTYWSSGVKLNGSPVNWGSKLLGSFSFCILGLYGGVICLSLSYRWKVGGLLKTIQYLHTCMHTHTHTNRFPIY